MFKNTQIKGYTYATRYIASWIKVGGKLQCSKDIDDFEEWLKSLNLDKEDINKIIFLATNGKLELEVSAKKFLKTS